MENHFNCIYMYVNKINKKVYIGKAKDFIKRHEQHLKGDLIIDRALKKYGEENFSIVFLEEDVEDNLQLNQLEKFYISEYDSYCKSGKGYNIAEGGNGGNTLEGMTDEQYKKWCIKNAESKKGKVVTDEARKNMSEAQKKLVQQEDYINPFKGKHHTEEQKQQWSEMKKGKQATHETKQKMSESHKQRWENMTDEEKTEFGRKVSERQTGEKNPMYGKRLTDEHKRKISENSPQKKKVHQYVLDGNYIQTFISISEAQRAVGIKSGVRLCCQGKIKQAGGYKWKYAEESEVEVC